MTDSTVLSQHTLTSPLFTPFRFRNGVVARNRIWLAPMTNLQSHLDGAISEDELNWLLRRATGGFGVIETCAAHVAEEGQSWEGQLSFCRLVHSCHAGNFRIIITFEGTLQFGYLTLDYLEYLVDRYDLALCVAANFDFDSSPLQGAGRQDQS